MKGIWTSLGLLLVGQCSTAHADAPKATSTPATGATDAPMLGASPTAVTTSSTACPIEGPRCIPPEGLHLDWKYPEIRNYQFVLTGIQAAAAFGSLAIPSSPRWTKPNDFDETARGALRANLRSGRQTARDISDVGLVVLINQRLVDDLFVTWWYHDRGDLARQLVLIDLQALTFSTAVAGIIAGATGRRRPYVSDECNRPQEDLLSDCTGSKPNRSYFSGHASTAFTLAGLTCMHHAHLPIYGGGFADGLACASTLAAASTVGLMRVVSDQHYVSDVLTGTGVGLLSGLGIPYLFHYAWSAPPARSARSTRDFELPPLAVVPTPTGISAMGAF